LKDVANKDRKVGERDSKVVDECNITNQSVPSPIYQTTCQSQRLVLNSNTLENIHIGKEIKNILSNLQTW